MKIKFYTGLAVLAAIVLISGATVLATASPATSSDPLITLSYLNGPFRTLINNEITAARNALEGTFNARASAIEARINSDISNALSNSANVFRSVTVTSGSPLVLATGSEVILRTGSASFSTSGGNLIKYSGTPTEEASGSLITNNMYLATGTVTISTSGTATLFVRSVGALPMSAGLDGFDFDLCPDCEFIFCMCPDADAQGLCDVCEDDPCVCE
ncbi:MAG: hypothetical protein FWD44_06005 [Oscillospiraceae bacterium]|nr:hypothetical protein [Oscillospiraceae bacterium]